MSDDPEIPSVPVRRVVDALARTLRVHLEISALRLWGVSRGEDTLLHASGAQPLTCSFTLTSRARRVGRLEIPRPGERGQTLLDRVVPWVGLVLDALQLTAEGLRGLDETMDEPGHARVALRTLGWRLTPAQSSVFDLLVTGLDDEAIAESLSCPLEAVRIHLRSIARTAGVGTRDDVARAYWGRTVRQGALPGLPPNGAALALTPTAANREGDGG